MKTATLTLFGKTVSYVSKVLGRGNGSTWPGHIALSLQKGFIQNLLKNSPTKIILIVGTNGKTTTTKILSTVLEENTYKVFENTSGANLLNGIASSLLLNTNARGHLIADFAIFEVDENNLSLVLKEITPTAIIALDLFRDQLDRYGELDTIAKKWAKEFSKLPSTTHLILNADDPLIAYLGLDTPAKIMYFGLEDGKEKILSHAADTTYCPRCNAKLTFSHITYSHLGLWSCKNCGLKRPKPDVTTTYFPLEGTYNKYNALAATAAALSLNLDKAQIDASLRSVTPAFGRQEKLLYKNKKVQIFLSKNPTGFNESLRTIAGQNAKHIFFLLNDRIPDGTDVSWIWDISTEEYIEKFDSIVISGDRCWDMGLRIQYSMKSQNPNHKLQTNSKVHVIENLKDALDTAIQTLPDDQTLYILPTYSAMLDVRKIITGRRIL